MKKCVALRNYKNRVSSQSLNWWIGRMSREHVESRGQSKMTDEDLTRPTWRKSRKIPAVSDYGGERKEPRPPQRHGLYVFSCSQDPLPHTRCPGKWNIPWGMKTIKGKKRSQKWGKHTGCEHAAPSECGASNSHWNVSVPHLSKPAFLVELLWKHTFTGLSEPPRQALLSR